MERWFVGIAKILVGIRPDNPPANGSKLFQKLRFITSHFRFLYKNFIWNFKAWGYVIFGTFSSQTLVVDFSAGSQPEFLLFLLWGGTFEEFAFSNLKKFNISSSTLCIIISTFPTLDWLVKFQHVKFYIFIN